MSDAAIIIDPCVGELAVEDLLTHVAFGEYISCQKDRADVFLQPSQAIEREEFTQAQFGRISFWVRGDEWTRNEIRDYFNLPQFTGSFLEPLLSEYLHASERPILNKLRQDLVVLQELALSIEQLPIWFEEASPDQIRFMTVSSDLVEFVQDFIRGRLQTEQGQRIVQQLIKDVS